MLKVGNHGSEMGHSQRTAALRNAAGKNMTRLPKWGCTKCGQLSSRRDTMKRHIRLVHKEGGAAVVTSTELLAGFQPRRYIENPRPHFGKNTPEKFLFAYGEGYWRELGRRAAHNAVFGDLSSTQNTRNPSSIKHNSIDGSPGKLFGFRVFVCENCLQQKYRYVYMTTTREGFRIEGPAAACSDVLLSNPKIAENKQAYIERFTKELPLNLEEIVRNQFVNPTLFAQLIDVRYGTITIKDRYDPTFCISFSTLAHLESTETDITSFDRSHWAFRAIQDGHVILNDSELKEVTKILKDSSFGFLRTPHVSNIPLKSLSDAAFPSYCDCFVYLGEGSHLT